MLARRSCAPGLLQRAAVSPLLLVVLSIKFNN